jgi:protocatechuate 3,4-dioxygenase beta subunit
VTLVAQWVPATGCLLVKVYNPQGEGYGAGWVKLYNSSYTFGPYNTNANGWYTFTNIPVGTYTLKADGPAPKHGPNRWYRPSITVTISGGTICQGESLQYTKE